MKFEVSALSSGTLFGAGLALSQMTNPAKVIAFLDVTGAWDPSLAFVMGAALIVATGGQMLQRRRRPSAYGPTAAQSLTSDGFPAAGIDARLIGGAALFGIGWGLAGFCPGPALASLVSGSPRVLLFVASMIVGMALYRGFDRSALLGARTLR